MELSADNVRKMEGKYRMNTDAGLSKEHYLLLDNTELSPAAAAERIIRHFSLRAGA